MKQFKLLLNSNSSLFEAIQKRLFQLGYTWKDQEYQLPKQYNGEFAIVLNKDKSLSIEKTNLKNKTEILSFEDLFHSTKSEIKRREIEPEFWDYSFQEVLFKVNNVAHLSAIVSQLILIGFTLKGGFKEGDIVYTTKYGEMLISDWDKEDKRDLRFKKELTIDDIYSDSSSSIFPLNSKVHIILHGEDHLKIRSEKGISYGIVSIKKIEQLTRFLKNGRDREKHPILYIENRI